MPVSISNYALDWWPWVCAGNVRSEEILYQGILKRMYFCVPGAHTVGFPQNLLIFVCISLLICNSNGPDIVSYGPVRNNLLGHLDTHDQVLVITFFTALRFKEGFGRLFLE